MAFLTKTVKVQTTQPIPISTGQPATDSFGNPLNLSDSDFNVGSYSPNPNSLNSPSEQYWQIDPELPRNMYMPCVGSGSSSLLKNKLNLNRIYILGSHKNNQCWVYDATYKTYEKLPIYPKKIIPKGHCVASCDNIIFSIGACTDNHQAKHFLFFNTISHEWHTAPNIRAKDFGIGSKCVAIHNKLINSIQLHVVGGNRKPNRYWIYNRSNKKWNEGPKLPLKLTYHGLIHVGKYKHDKQNNNKRKSVRTYLRNHASQLIVFGGCNVKKGWNQSLKPTTKMYRLYLNDDVYNNDDIKDNNNNIKQLTAYHYDKWEYCGDLPVAIQNFGYICVLNNYILIFGGDLGDLKCSRKIYVYNISTKKWKLLGIKLPEHLYGMTAIEINGIIHIFGGHNGQSSQRIHLSIKTSILLRKEFDDFDQSFTWKELSQRTGDNDESLLDELKRTKRKMRDTFEKYNLLTLQLKQFQTDNDKYKKSNIQLLDKLAQSMQDKEEISYKIKQMKSIAKTSGIGYGSPSTPRGNKSKNKIKKRKNKSKKHKFKYSSNPYIDNDVLRDDNDNNKNKNKNKSKDKDVVDPKYIMFRNFLYGRIGLPQYLNEFRTASYSNICKIQNINDNILKLNCNISNELHRKLIMKILNEFKLEILQFKSWMKSYNDEPNLIQYIKIFTKHGIITWNLLAQHITCKNDFQNKFDVDNDIAINCLYDHLLLWLNGDIPQPKQHKNINNVIDNNNNNNIDINNYQLQNGARNNHNDNSDDNAVMFDDAGYNW